MHQSLTRGCAALTAAPLAVARPAGRLPLRAVASAARSSSTTTTPISSSSSFKNDPRRVGVRARAAGDAEPAGPPQAAAPADDAEPEETLFLETNGAPASLAFQVLMGATIVYLPLTIAALGRAAWINIRVTSKRLEIVNSSPLFSGTQQVAWSQVEEVRSAPRAFDAWGDVVLFLRGGGTVELTGMPRHREIVEYVTGRIVEARRAGLERKMRDAAGGSAGGEQQQQRGAGEVVDGVAADE